MNESRMIIIVGLDGVERKYNKVYDKQDNKWLKLVMCLAGMYLAFASAVAWFTARLMLAIISEGEVSIVSIQAAAFFPLTLYFMAIGYTGMFLTMFYTIRKSTYKWVEISTDDKKEV